MMKLLGSLVAALGIGYLVAWAVYGRDELILVAPPVESDVVTAVTTESRADVAALRVDYERQIADLERQLEEARLRPEEDVTVPVVATIGERSESMREMRESAIDSAIEKETQQLLAAGFTRERIEWIRNRADELKVQFLQRMDLLTQQGTPDLEAQIAYSGDNDILLREVISDDEYARYRQALGRPIGVRVARLLPGGKGEAAGLKVGDQVISYNGTRVFNLGELAPLTREALTYGGIANIVVLRDGQEVLLSALAGNLGLEGERGPLPTSTLEELRSGFDAFVRERGGLEGTQ